MINSQNLIYTNILDLTDNNCLHNKTSLVATIVYPKVREWKIT